MRSSVSSIARRMRMRLRFSSESVCRNSQMSSEILSTPRRSSRYTVSTSLLFMPLVYYIFEKFSILP